jgi:hypothetical protein
MPFVDGTTPRLIVNLPPRHLRTSLFSVCLSAWKFAHQPSAKFMVVTYAEHLAESIARNIRNILQAQWFKETFQTRIAKDHSAAKDFATSAGGALYAVSFGGGITGRGADLIIVDDPHDIKDAGNLQQLDRTIEQFNTVVLSRLNNRRTGKVIVIAHRVHENDLSGHLLRQGKWRHVALPTVAVSDVAYDTDYGCWRRRKDAWLRPDAFDLEDIEDLKANTHNPAFEMLYQQDADGHALPPITEDCFRSFAMLSSSEPTYVMSVDPGMTPGSKNSFSAIQLWCPNGSNHYLVNQWRKQCDFAVLRSLLLCYFNRYRPSAILIEKTANGPALNSMMTHRLQEIIRERGFAGISIQSWLGKLCCRNLPLGVPNSLPNSSRSRAILRTRSMPPPSIWTGSAETRCSNDRPSLDSAQVSGLTVVNCLRTGCLAHHACRPRASS